MGRKLWNVEETANIFCESSVFMVDRFKRRLNAVTDI